ncbi:unnamed protein product [Brachionus calyciflorus]|uniref:Peptidase M14 domain-containing protein n=1 Tax=Brachionus calyciflorus TaxID=104777 RepID=A0A813PJ59_9BILA|nr:unnamed protein product [Brachionus calyciflorus]
MTNHNKLKRILLFLAILLISKSNCDDQINIQNLLLSEYHDYDALKALLETFQSSYSNISKLISIGKSAEHRDLFVFQITDQIDRVEPGEPSVKLIANTHGEEAVGRELLVNLIYYLLENYQKDEKVTSLIDSTNIYIMPTSNPDVFEKIKNKAFKCESDPSFKNVEFDFPNRLNSNLTKENMFESRESETVSLMNWILNNKFVLSGNLKQTVPIRSNLNEDLNIVEYLETSYLNSKPKSNEIISCSDVLVNKTHGNMQEFNYFYSNTIEVNLNLVCCKYPPIDKLKFEWENNRNALINFLSRVHMGIKGFITDFSDSKFLHENGVLGTPIQNAVITVEGYTHNVTSSINGDYWRPLLPNTYRITASAFGFKSETKIVQVIENHVTELNFTLSRENLEIVPHMFAEEKNELDILVSQINLLTNLNKRDSLLINTVEPQETNIHNQEDLEEFLKNVEKKCSNIATVHSLGKSVNGTGLYSIIISDNPKVHEKGEPEVKLIGNLHGDEIISRELLIQFIDFLCENYDKNELVKRLVDSTRIHIAPSVNPDGYAKKSRNNANNVDLENNFPTIFKVKSIQKLTGESTQKSNVNKILEILKGKEISINDQNIQPETNFLMLWSREHPFILSGNLDSGSLTVKYPFNDNKNGEVQETPTPDDDTFKMLAKSYSLAHPRMAFGYKLCQPNQKFQDGITNGAAWYTNRGSMQDWTYLNTNDMQIKIEISCEKNVDQAKLIVFWEENKYSLFSFIGQAHKGIKGVVRDQVTKLAIQNATIQIEDIPHNVTTYRYGDYWRILTPGHYYLSVSHPKYETAKVKVKVGQGSATVVNFDLKPIGINYDKIVNEVITVISTNSYAYLITGLSIIIIILIIISLVVKSFKSNSRITLPNNLYTKLDQEDNRKLLFEDDEEFDTDDKLFIR